MNTRTARTAAFAAAGVLALSACQTTASGTVPSTVADGAPASFSGALYCASGVQTGNWSYTDSAADVQVTGTLTRAHGVACDSRGDTINAVDVPVEGGTATFMLDFNDGAPDTFAITLTKGWSHPMLNPLTAKMPRGMRLTRGETTYSNQGVLIDGDFSHGPVF